jgi:DNA-binding NarL/FixJ family response regulator
MTNTTYPLDSNTPTEERRAPDKELAGTLATGQAAADLDVAKLAAELLDAPGLSELRAWIDARLAPLVSDERLSAREAEVVRLIALGYSNKQIAVRIKVSVKTIETYKTRAMEKLGIRSRVGLVRYALSRGWLGAGDDTDESA